MKKIALFLAAAALSCAAGAQALSLEPVNKPLDPALLHLESQSKSPFEVRALDVPSARALLASTEGPAWRVLALEAPACATAPLPKEKQARKEARELCREKTRECKNAQAFAVEHASHVACSELYIQTTVLLANDGNGKQVKASPAKRVKATPAHRSRKTSKPQAGSC